MKNIYISYLASLLCFLLVSCRASVDSRDRYVVVLSMDGFRSDYPSRAHTPSWILWRMWGFAPRFARVIPA